MMTNDEIIAVVQAHKEGKRIEQKCAQHGWRSCTTPAWDFENSDYRVAPTPRKPREWFAEIPTDGGVGQIFTDSRQLAVGGELVRVREIIEW